MATRIAEEAALLAALDEDTRAVMLDWRARHTPSKARWRAALRTERLGPYRAPGAADREYPPSLAMQRAVRSMARGLTPTPLQLRALVRPTVIDPLMGLHAPLGG